MALDNLVRGLLIGITICEVLNRKINFAIVLDDQR